MYGGDGRTTFALPDLRGRVPIHAGTGPGLTPRRIGQRGGMENTTLQGGSNASTNNSGQDQVPRSDSQVNNMQPYLTVNYIIALQGIFPSRS